MANNLSNYAEKLLLDFLMTASTATRPSARYLALFTSDPAEDGSGTELSGDGYSRQAVTFDDASSPGGTTQNSNAPSFTASGGNWGTVSHVAIFDADTAGNMLWYGPLDTSRVVNDGDTISFAIGDIDLTLS